MSLLPNQRCERRSEGFLRAFMAWPRASCERARSRRLSRVFSRFCSCPCRVRLYGSDRLLPRVFAGAAGSFKTRHAAAIALPAHSAIVGVRWRSPPPLGGSHGHVPNRHNFAHARSHRVRAGPDGVLPAGRRTRSQRAAETQQGRQPDQAAERSSIPTSSSAPSSRSRCRPFPTRAASPTLGREREGSGVVIGERGLILTIGYLIVEADDVSITDSRGRTYAARVVAYDHVTGLGLVRTIAPLDAKPVTFGDSGKLANREPVMIAGAGDDGVAFAYVVSKRAFSGSWEYALDQAIFTSPPTLNWSGAALFDKDGKLARRRLADRARRQRRRTSKLPGNMFVPIDLLEADPAGPGEGRSPRRSRASVDGRVDRRVAGTPRGRPRVSPDGPGRPGRLVRRRHHPGCRRRRRADAGRFLPEGVEPRQRRRQKSRSSCCRAWTYARCASNPSIGSNTSGGAPPTERPIDGIEAARANPGGSRDVTLARTMRRCPLCRDRVRRCSMP